MSTPLTPCVLNAVAVLFAEDNQPAAVKLLEEDCGHTLPLMTSDDPAKAIERIRLAVVKLSGGSLQMLRYQIKNARHDWRDSLVFAGFGDDIHAHLQWVPVPPQRQT